MSGLHGVSATHQPSTAGQNSLKNITLHGNCEPFVFVLDHLIVLHRWPRQDKFAHCGDFRSLCLVSKRIGRIAQPFLFNKIAVFDLRTLLKL